MSMEINASNVKSRAIRVGLVVKLQFPSGGGDDSLYTVGRPDQNHDHLPMHTLHGIDSIVKQKESER